MTAGPLAQLPTQLAGKINPAGPGACWLWTAGTFRDGYGSVKWTGRAAVAHRVVFHLLADPSLPVFPGRTGDALVLDHRCRVKRCVNPAHLRVTTNRANTVAGRSGVLGEHSSRFVGVYWHRDRGRWQAALRVGGRRRCVGYFASPLVAALAYDAAVMEHHGPDAPSNRSLGLLDGGDADAAAA